VNKCKPLPAGSTQSKVPTNRAFQCFHFHLKLSVGVARLAMILGSPSLLTQGSRPGRTFGESVGGILEMDSSDSSNEIRYHIFDTRLDTEFNRQLFCPGTVIWRPSNIIKLSSNGNKCPG